MSVARTIGSKSSRMRSTTRNRDFAVGRRSNVRGHVPLDLRGHVREQLWRGEGANDHVATRLEVSQRTFDNRFQPSSASRHVGYRNESKGSLGVFSSDSKSSDTMRIVKTDLPVSRHILALPSGRRLEWTECGPSDGPVVLHHHITPGGAEPQRNWTRGATARGLRFVTLARPGYGRSDREPGRSMADVARDSAALLDALGVDEVFVSGSSGGGPFALACGALLGKRARAVVSVAGPAPYGMPDLDYTAGMSADNVEELGAAVEGESEVRPLLEGARKGMLAACANPAALRAGMSRQLPAVDAACLTETLAEDVARGMLDALATGADGWIDDDLAGVRPWGFDLEALAGVPVAIWHGEEDRAIPVSHGRWLAAHIPGARAHLLAGEGHLSIGHAHIDEVLDEMLEWGTRSRTK